MEFTFKVVTPSGGDSGWRVRLTADSPISEGNVSSYEVFEQYGQFCSCLPGPYGNPLLQNEPILGIELEGLVFADGKPVPKHLARAVGVVIVDEDENGGQVGMQFSFSNLKRLRKSYSEPNVEKGTMKIDEEEYKIVDFFMPDHNRLISLVVVLTKTPAEGWTPPKTVSTMADLFAKVEY